MAMQTRLPLEMIRREAARLLGAHDATLTAGERYLSDYEVHEIGLRLVGRDPVFFQCDRRALDLSLDDFSEMYVKPAVEAIQKQAA